MAAKKEKRKSPTTPPAWEVMEAAITRPSPEKLGVLERTHAVFCAFIGALSNRLWEILKGEDCELKDALELLLKLPSDRGYYPLSVLIKGPREVAPSYFQRIGYPSDAEDGPTSFRQKLATYKEVLGNEKYKPKKGQLTKEQVGQAHAELARKINAYDQIVYQGSVFPEFQIWFEKKANRGWELPGAVLELVLMEALQYVSHALEQEERLREEEKSRLKELEAFEASDQGKLLIKACRELKDGAKTWLTEAELIKMINWRGKCTEVVEVPPRTREEERVKMLRANNPEIDAFLLAKAVYCKLLRPTPQFTWTKVSWRGNEKGKGKRYPFFSQAKFTDELKLEGGFATLRFRGLDVSDEAYAAALRGEPHGGFALLGGRGGESLGLVFTPDARLVHAVWHGANSFVVTDVKSGTQTTRRYTGLRFKKLGDNKWVAKLTFQPMFQEREGFSQPLKDYAAGRPPQFAAGTILCGFAVTVRGSYRPSNDNVGWFGAWGVNEDGTLTRLWHQAVAPYLEGSGDKTLPYPKEDGDTKERRYRKRQANFKRGDTKRAARGEPEPSIGELRQRKKIKVAFGPAKLVTPADLVQAKAEIYAQQRASGKGRRPDQSPLQKGDNRHAWDRLKAKAQCLRDNTVASVLRLVLSVSGMRQLQGALTAEEIKPPQKLQEWRERYPEGLVLLVVPAPMGASHGRALSKAENTVRHTMGIAGIYTTLLQRQHACGVMATFVTKVGLGNRCPGCGGRIPALNQGEIPCEHCGKKFPVGLVLTDNLVFRLLNPLTKKEATESEEPPVEE